MRADEQHAENRTWTLEALDSLEAFLDDPDFEGSPEEERVEIDQRRRVARDAKYRVVVLGAFNVGKSTLINAYLGDEYLPRILEECTTKVTHVVRGDNLAMVLRLSDRATPEEVQALQELITSAGVEAEVFPMENGSDIEVAYARSNPRELRNTLNALITIFAEEDFPRLRTLREKFVEVFAFVPDEAMQVDIDLIDSPGVHNIAETESKMGADIIPNSHLVLCMLDSQNAGNQHNRQFIESLIQHRRRKVFFIINKADQLNEDEIDLEGRRGPAKDLLRGLRGIVENPELFFVSSLYALLGRELADGKVTLEDIDRDNKVRIPLGRQRELLASENPAGAVAEYLIEQSRFPALRDRMLDYLYHENREGAVVPLTCEVVADKAWRYARPLQARLDMARNVPRLDELRRERARLESELAMRRNQAQQARDLLDALSSGGEYDGTEHPGYAATAEKHFDPALVENRVTQPLREWLADRENFRNAKRHGFRPLTQEIEQRIERYLEEATRDTNAYADTTEARVRERVESYLGVGQGLGVGDIEPPHAEVPPVRARMGRSYLLWLFIGALLGGAAGAAAGIWTGIEQYAEPLRVQLLPDVALPPGILGGLAGAVVGGILGLIARASGSDEARRERLERVTGERVEQVLLQHGREQLLRRADERRTAFAASVQAAFERITSELEQQIATIRSEEDELATTQEQTITRLEPKVESLTRLAERARDIFQAWRQRAEAAV